MPAVLLAAAAYPDLLLVAPPSSLSFSRPSRSPPHAPRLDCHPVREPGVREWRRRRERKRSTPSLTSPPSARLALGSSSCYDAPPPAFRPSLTDPLRRPASPACHSPGSPSSYSVICVPRPPPPSPSAAPCSARAFPVAVAVVPSAHKYRGGVEYVVDRGGEDGRASGVAGCRVARRGRGVGCRVVCRISCRASRVRRTEEATRCSFSLPPSFTLFRPRPTWQMTPARGSHVPGRVSCVEGESSPERARSS
ncbi:hypothetical protein B0H11DRAFT_2367154 [Mycena galericulata]|nr:hypothetical protein B0H11DRAFT_2367154 [Mycena galericulata]